MVRIGAIFIAVCMVLIAASIGAVLYLAFKLDVRTCALVALGALVAMALYNTISNRLSDRRTLGDQIADLSRGTADLARQVGEIARRLNAMETKVDKAVERARIAVDPLASEMGELGTLVRQIAETVASHAAALQKQGAMPAVAARRAADAGAAAPASDGALNLTEREAVGGPPPFKGLSREAIAELIAGAVDSDRIDLYLQPIVTLPQRKVRYYEAVSRLRTEAGEVVPAGDFIDVAESVGLMPKIDNLLLFRCVQVVRRLQLKSRDVGLFCNISAATLTDADLLQAIPRFHGRQPRAQQRADVRVQPGRLSRLRPARARSSGGAGRARLPLLHGSRHRSAHGAEGIGRPLVPLPEGAGQIAARQVDRRAKRHPS